MCNQGCLDSQERVRNLGYQTCDRQVVPSTIYLVAIKWLLLGWVTVCG